MTDKAELLRLADVLNNIAHALFDRRMIDAYAAAAILRKLAEQDRTSWADKAMELATDFAIESLRVGSYERRDSIFSGRCTIQTGEIREKREASRDRLRHYLYAAPVPKE